MKKYECDYCGSLLLHDAFTIEVCHLDPEDDEFYDDLPEDVAAVADELFDNVHFCKNCLLKFLNLYSTR